MSRLATFFHGSATQWGLFYPTHYLVAIFPDYVRAQEAVRAVAPGQPCGEAIAVPGDDVVEFADERRRRHRMASWLMETLSRLFDTEAVFADRDLEMARSGAAMVAVRCPTLQAKQAAWRRLEGTHPRVARYYSSGGIEHLGWG